MKSCESCGLPDGISPGLKLRLIFRESGQVKTRIVWVCGPFCGWLTLAQRAMGMDSSKWPCRLHQFIAANPKLLKFSIVDPTVTKPPSENIENAESSEGKKTSLIYRDGKPGFVTQDKGGRPRMHRSNAERQRAYRRRH